jgi:IclR family transcriptional regulator, pca regulon regulatory protein
MPRSASNKQERSRVVAPPATAELFKAPRYSTSLARGLAILACFTPERPVMGIADIADRLGMSRSTTHRYMTTLSELGCLEQGESRKYRLGLRVTDLGLSALNSTGLPKLAHPYLEELRDRTSYSASLGVLDDQDVVYLDHARSFRRWPGSSEPDLLAGSGVPAYASSMGKLLLAHLPESFQRETIANTKLVKLAPNTITSRKALTEQLKLIQDNDLVGSDQELRRDLISIAAPVRNANGQTTAAVDIVAHGSTTSLKELLETAGSHLTSAAAAISAELGSLRAS